MQVKIYKRGQRYFKVERYRSFKCVFVKDDVLQFFGLIYQPEAGDSSETWLQEKQKHKNKRRGFL